MRENSGRAHFVGLEGVEGKRGGSHHKLDKDGEPLWITCPVCGTKMLCQTKWHLSCGAHKCELTLRKWKRLAERIKEGNPTWWAHYMGGQTSRTTN